MSEVASGQDAQSIHSEGIPGEDDGGYRVAMKKLSPEDLRKLFRKYDEDGSGEISVDELQAVLAKLMGKLPSEEALMSLLEDIDKDGSGSIDEDEFLEFFAKIENMYQLQQKLEMMGKKSTICQKFLLIFVVFNFVAFCFFFLLDMGAPPGTMKKQLGHIGTIASGGLLIAIFVLGVLGPILKYKVGFKVGTFIAKKVETKRRASHRRGGVILEIEKKMTAEQSLVSQADLAFETLPRPPDLPPPSLSPPLPPGCPSVSSSYRQSKRTSRTNSLMLTDYPMSPMSGSGFSLPSSPANATGRSATQNIVKVGNPSLTGYDQQSYMRSRELMAFSGGRTFTPLSKADKIPWMSAEADLQIKECQPYLWADPNDEARSTPATSALPSPSGRPLPPEIGLSLQGDRWRRGAPITS